MFFQSGPQYTIRMLVDNITSANPTEKAPSLKQFAHFTLGCTTEDKTPQVESAFAKLDENLGKSVAFKAISVQNLGSDQDPLWAVQLDINNDFRTFLAGLFDPIMCAETNGNTYLWGNGSKLPHVTLGKGAESKLLGEKLVGCTFEFVRMDYKKVGPHDPHVSCLLSQPTPVSAATDSSPR